MSRFTTEEIDRLFDPAPIEEHHYVRLAEIRQYAKSLAASIVRSTPPGADQSAAIRKLREAVDVATCAIVRTKEI